MAHTLIRNKWLACKRSSCEFNFLNCSAPAPLQKVAARRQMGQQTELLSHWLITGAIWPTLHLSAKHRLGNVWESSSLIILKLTITNNCCLKYRWVWRLKIWLQPIKNWMDLALVINENIWSFTRWICDILNWQNWLEIYFNYLSLQYTIGQDSMLLVFSCLRDAWKFKFILCNVLTKYQPSFI